MVHSRDRYLYQDMRLNCCPGGDHCAAVLEGLVGLFQLVARVCWLVGIACTVNCGIILGGIGLRILTPV